MTTKIHVKMPLLEWREESYCGIEDFDSTDDFIIEYSYFSKNRYWRDPPMFLIDVDEADVCPKCFVEVMPLSPYKPDGVPIQIEHQRSRYSRYQTRCGVEMNGEMTEAKHVFKDNVKPNEHIPPEGRVPRLNCNACAAAGTYEICKWEK